MKYTPHRFGANMRVRVCLCSPTRQVMKCDLNELQSVRAFAQEFKTKHGTQLDVLVNNGEASLLV